MKYLKKFDQINESNLDIHSICQKYNITNYTINEDGSIDVDGYVDLSYQKLTKLPIQFGKVSGYFYCNDNKLTTLEGAPKEVGLDFYCYNNQLTTLEGAPLSVGGHFDCDSNQLISLKGAPLSVGGDFNCRYNELVTLNGISEIGGHFDCGGNSVEEICDFGYNPVQVIWDIFYNNKFLEKIKHIYTDLWMSDGWTLQGDVLEQIAEELGIELSEDWIDQVEAVGYQVI